MHESRACDSTICCVATPTILRITRKGKNLGNAQRYGDENDKDCEAGVRAPRVVTVRVEE